MEDCHVPCLAEGGRQAEPQLLERRKGRWAQERSAMDYLIAQAVSERNEWAGTRVSTAQVVNKV